MDEKLNSDLFGISEDHIEHYQSLDVRFIKNKAATFFFEMQGLAMAPYILEKDILIVDRSLDAFSGCIVVAILDGEFLCRCLEFTDKDVILRAINPNLAVIQIAEQELQIFGVVRSFVRECI